MKSSFNKRKINFFLTKKFFKYILILIIVIFLFLAAYYEIKNKERFVNLIQEFSFKFNYQLKFYEVNSLSRVDKKQVIEILSPYFENSIFLIPLNQISISLKNLKWIKDVNLSTNLKNKIKVEVLEYKPIGLYSFNDKIFYFSEKGSIIDVFDEKISKDFIIFYGKQALKNAPKILKIIDILDHYELEKINEAYFINERRWNIKLNNGILVYLSEKNIEDSLKNYIKLIEKLKNKEIISIKSIDLRNNVKAIMGLR